MARTVAAAMEVSRDGGSMLGAASSICAGRGWEGTVSGNILGKMTEALWVHMHNLDRIALRPGAQCGTGATRVVGMRSTQQLWECYMGKNSSQK